MLRPSPGRRRPRHGPQICCAAAASFLLLLSIAVLHSRLSSSASSSRFLPRRSASINGLSFPGLVLRDADESLSDDSISDRIDLSDIVDESAEPEAPDFESVGFFWDHAIGAIRRSFGAPLGHRWRQISAQSSPEIAFASDDLPIDSEIRSKSASIRSIEDALLLKSPPGVQSPLREGWARWFEAKGRYLRQDRMFRSSVEQMNPMNNPLLQDPDGQSLTFLSRGDRLMQKSIAKELLSTPFPAQVDQKRTRERKTLEIEKKNRGSLPIGRRDRHIYPDGRNWGYYPGLEENLSFSEFVRKFFSAGECSLRIFMVWNSPAWAYGVRFQRSLESIFHHHKDACVLVLSETMELDFFKDFATEGFKIAVAMPNLEELLKDTPVRVFASVWPKWRMTRHYPLHYSELIRLATLYKYGGIYLDPDVIVLKPLSSLKNSIGQENEIDGRPTYNGAVLAFDKHSPFVMECMKEFYATYDDSRLRWNGAELLTRVIDKLQSKLNVSVEPSHKFFPISATYIIRYFNAPVDEEEMSEQSTLLTKILTESTTFHFWNSSTFSLVPELGSLSEKLINCYCLRCLDVL